MAIDRSLIGATSPQQTFTVERGAIRKFADAIGDTTPAYQQGDIAPPTFPITFWVQVPALAQVDTSRLIHGNESFTYERPIYPGDVLTCQRRVTDLFEKEGKLGRMQFVTTVVEGRDSAGELVFTGTSTIIIHGEGKA